MAATHTAASGMTLERFLKLPEEKPALEYFEGVVRQKVAPMAEHSALQGQIFSLLNAQIRPNNIGRAFPEPRSTYDRTSLVPDVSVYRQERIARTASGRLISRVLTPPDVAIEIRSPGQTVRDLTKRCEWFLGHGVQVALLVDDRDETIRVFRPGREMEVARGDDLIDLSELAPRVSLIPRQIFAELIVD